MALLKFLQWNVLFIVTDMVASVMMRVPFTLESVLIEWFWWNVAYYLILGLMFPMKGIYRGMSQRFREARRK